MKYNFYSVNWTALCLVSLFLSLVSCTQLDTENNSRALDRFSKNTQGHNLSENKKTASLKKNNKINKSKRVAKTENLKMVSQTKRLTQAVVKSSKYPVKADDEYRILIDVGHGGKDLGARGLSRLSEKNIILKIGKLVRKRLHLVAAVTGYNLNIRLSREKDVFIGLRERVRIANEWDADLFVSIHANASPVRKPRGFEVYFLSHDATDKEANRLALKENGGKLPKVEGAVMNMLSDLQQNHHIRESFHFAEVMYHALSRKIRPNGRAVRQGPFTVLHGTNMPAVLVEVGYLTNPTDSKQLNTLAYRKKVAHAISTGIIEYVIQDLGVS